MTTFSTSALTGAAVSGLTTPTHTWTEDNAPSVDSRRFNCSSLGGTQTGCETHSVSSPFFMLVQRPSTIKPMGPVNPITGQLKNVLYNNFRIRLYKGQTMAGTVPIEAISMFDLNVRAPAGVELSTCDPEEFKTAVSGFIGFLSANSQALYDMITTGAIK